jgi:hypothetical protein
MKKKKVINKYSLKNDFLNKNKKKIKLFLIKKK